LDYLSLYRKWRPQRFDEGFVGQEHLVRTLTNAIILNKVAHAYLFTGPRGTGKTTAAKILAKALNCTGRGTDPNPCNTCPNCEKINAGISLDVLEIDGASNRGIDEVRDLREKIKFAPVEGEYKVYIIDEVHMLTTEAFNALLKTLEEPPPHIIFIFATTEAHKVPATILSRCQRFDFKRLTPEEIFAHLKYICTQEGFQAEEAALEMIAQEARGGLRDAIGLLEQCMAHADQSLTVADTKSILGLVETEALFSLAQAIADRNFQTGLSLLEQVYNSGKDLQVFAKQIAKLCRDLLVLLVAGDEAPVSLEAEWRSKGGEIAEQIGLPLLKKGVDLFLEAGMGLKRGVEGLLPLEMALIQLLSPQEGASAGSLSLAAQLETLEKRVEKIETLITGKLRSASALPQQQTEEKAALHPVAASRKVHKEDESGGSPSPKEKASPLSEPATFANQDDREIAASERPSSSSLEKSSPLKKTPSKKTMTSPSEKTTPTAYWDEILAVVRERKRTVEALLREGKPRPSPAGKFIIEFSPEFKFHWENTKRPDNLRLVEEAILRVTGQELKVECLLEEGQNSPKERDVEEEPDILRNALDLFGGKVIKSDH